MLDYCSAEVKRRDIGVAVVDRVDRLAPVADEHRLPSLC
jgi:hypothetical protein